MRVEREERARGQEKFLSPGQVQAHGDAPRADMLDREKQEHRGCPDRPIGCHYTDSCTSNGESSRIASSRRSVYIRSFLDALTTHDPVFLIDICSIHFVSFD